MISTVSRAAGIMLAALFLLLTGCTTEAECSEEKPCALLEQCVEGQCVERTCGSSADCGMEAWCDAGTCVAGCQQDGDCYPGDKCDPDNGACVAEGCRTTTLDCDFGQFCNQATGDCYEANGYYCRPCGGETDCGGNGNQCLDFGAGGEFCGVTCEVESDCPAGYTCWPGASPPQCITYCWLYIDDRRSIESAP